MASYRRRLDESLLWRYWVMRKILTAFLILSVLAYSAPATALGVLPSDNVSTGTSALIGTTAEENPALYKDLFIALIYLQVETAIDDYYDDYMTYLPSEDPWSYEILSIEKAPIGSYAYTVQLQVRPYVGPHISVGLDRITLLLGLAGTKTVKLEHLESYPLPSHYSGMIKSKLPGT